MATQCDYDVADRKTIHREPWNGPFGNAGRNAFIGPGLANSDISALKEIEIGREGHRLQFRVDFFNLFNHPNFDLPNRIFDSRTFGEVRSSNANGDNPPRQIQLALRYSF